MANCCYGYHIECASRWVDKFQKYSDKLATLETSTDAVRSFAVTLEGETKLIKKGTHNNNNIDI